MIPAIVRYASSLGVSLLLGCSRAPTPADSAPTGSATTESTSGDSGTPTEPTVPPEDLCTAADAVDGEVELGDLRGDGVTLSLTGRRDGVWSDGCYGGYIEDRVEASAGAFRWRARIYPSGGGPYPRDVLAVGCVTTSWMDLSIIELDEEPFWGPWRLERSAEDLEFTLCD